MPRRLAKQRMTLSHLEWPFQKTSSASRVISAVAEFLVNTPKQVRMALGFSKAFDITWPPTLIDKTAQLRLPKLVLTGSKTSSMNTRTAQNTQEKYQRVQVNECVSECVGFNVPLDT